MTRLARRRRTWIEHSDERHLARARSSTTRSAWNVCRTRSADAAGTGTSVIAAASKPTTLTMLQRCAAAIAAYPLLAAPSTTWAEGAIAHPDFDPRQLLREIVPVHKAFGAGGLEQIGLLAFARFLAQPGGQLLLVLGALLGAGQEAADRVDGRRRPGRGVIAVADRLGRTRVEQLGPHLAEQCIRRIDVAAADLAIDREYIADHIVRCLAGFPECLDIGLLLGHQLLVLERELQARGRFRRRNRRADLVGQILLQTAHAVPHRSLFYAGLVTSPRRNVLCAPA